MRRSLLAFAAACVLLVPMTLRAPQAMAAPEPAPLAQTPAHARVIVKFKPSGTLARALAAKPAGRRFAQHAAALSQRTGLRLTDGHALNESTQVVFASGMTSAQLAKKLAADSEVEYAEPDVRRRIVSLPNDPLYADGQTGVTPAVGQWYLRAPTATNVSAIDAQTAWDTTTGTSSVVVAVLDTGVRFDHPDLAGKMYAGYDFIADPATANDGTGRDGDASDPGDWLTDAEVNTPGGPFYGGSPTNCTDFNSSTGRYVAVASSWHGTQVAGLIGAATHNGTGMASVGRNVMVLPVRVLGKCGGYDSDIQAGMLWAAGLLNSPVANPHPAKVINLSLGSSGTCTANYQSVISQLTAAGVTVVASAGNEEGLAVDAPANCPGVIGVTGVRHIGTKVGFANVGSEVAISAPAGNCVSQSGACQYPMLTTINAGTTVPDANTYSDGFDYSVGTSFSAPLVAATAALMLSVDPQLTPAQIKSTLMSTARPFPTSGADPSVQACHAPNGVPQDECYCPNDGSLCGAGLLDANRAVLAVASASAPTAPLSASDANPVVGNTVTLDASAATVAHGRLGTYQWSISDPAIASFSTATDRPSVTLVTHAPGTVTATLTVTDDLGSSTSASTTMTVGPVPVVTAAPSSGGGGGALSFPWLLGLAAAVAALRRVRV